MASGDIAFAATGVTDSPLLEGAGFGGEWIETYTVVMRACSNRAVDTRRAWM